MVDEFIGSVFNDGKLTVIGWDGERQGTAKVYQCHCSKCAEDKELYGNAVFRSTKRNLVNGQLPCGCSKNPRWSLQQYRVLISRRTAGRYTAVVPDDDVKATTKVSCRCNAEGCGHEWEATIRDLLNNGCGCRKCAGKLPITEDEAVSKITKICSEKNFRFIEFKDGWQNRRSRLLLECYCGKSWDPEYASIVNAGSGCPDCNGGGYNRSLPGTFYCYLWTHKDTGDQHLKYGITNNPKQRIKQQRRKNKSFTAKQLCSIPFTDGNIPANLEKAIDVYRKTDNIANPVNKTEFPDGHTETLPISAWQYISNLIQSETMCKLTPLQ